MYPIWGKGGDEWYREAKSAFSSTISSLKFGEKIKLDLKEVIKNPWNMIAFILNGL